MLTVTYKSFKKNFKFYLDKVCNNHLHLVITDAGGNDIVILTKSDYDSIEETLHLF